MIQPGHFRPDLFEAKDLHRALTALARPERIRWLRLCCLKMSLGMVARIDVVRSSGEVLDVLLDFYSICGQNGLTLEWATGLAEHLVDGKDVSELLIIPGR